MTFDDNGGSLVMSGGEQRRIEIQDKNQQRSAPELRAEGPLGAVSTGAGEEAHKLQQNPGE